MPSTHSPATRNNRKHDLRPTQVQSHEVAQSGAGLNPEGMAQRTYGNQAIMRASLPPVTPNASSAPLIQRDGEKSAHWRWKYGNKVGKEKRSSEKSRQESEELLNQTPEAAAKAIFDILHSKQSEMEKFERVAMALAGQPSGDLGYAYSTLGGQLLNSDIEKTFSNKYQIEYLKEMRANGGVPTMRMMLYTALGKVTSSGFFSKSKVIAQLPMSGNYTDMLGDTKRFAELIKRAEPKERREILGDQKLMDLLRDEKKAFWQILVNQVDVDVAKEELDAQQNAPQNAPNPNALLGGKLMGARGRHSHLSTKEQESLAQAHELELVDLLKGCIEKKITFNKDKFADGVRLWRLKATPADLARVIDPNGVFQKAIKDELKFVPFIGKNKKLDVFINNLISITPTVHLNQEKTLALAKDQQLALYVKEATGAGGLTFDAKKLYERVLDWRSKATTEDIAWVTRPDSEFRNALSKVNLKVLGIKIILPYAGMNKDTEKFFVDLILNPSTVQQDNHVAAVKGNLDRQGEYVDRGKGRRSPLGMLDRFINDKRFPQLLAEMGMMSEEQREKLLNELDPTSTDNALVLLEEKVRRAGMNKEERAQVRAMFSLKHGKPGGGYIELWSIVMPGQITRIKAAMGHLKPAKWSKMGEVGKRQDIGKDIYKALLELEDEEYLQVRQDKALIAKFKEYSEKTSYWEKILNLLGMKDENDQIASSGSLRKDQAKAVSDGKHNPIRWAYMLDDAIEEKYTMTRYVEGKDNKLERKHFGEGVGAGANKGHIYAIVSRAQQAAAEAEQFGNTTALGFMMSVYLQLEQINRNKALYIKERMKPVHLALTANIPIPVDERIKRAKKEGFGVGVFSKIDRQRYYESFQHVHGRQLLDQWSNIDEFMQLRETIKEMDDEIVKLTMETSQKLPNTATPEEIKEQTEKKIKLEAILKEHPQQMDRMRRFTIGIKQSRRMEMKALRLNAQDRIKLEGMVSDKIIDAANKDTEVQKYLDEIGLPYDEYMQQKVKAVDSLEMQRHLDTTRQWRWFATKGSQLKEATRNVKGSVTSTENQQRKTEKDKTLTPQQQMDKLRDIRDTGAKKTEESIKDREMIEARFRDMQASFKARAQAICKLIAFAIVTGLTMGLGAPLSIGIHIAVEAGLQAMETAYNYFVLKENTFQDVAVGFMMGLLQRTVTVLTGNLAVVLNQSVLHPQLMGPGSEWVDRSISRSIAGLANSAFMFAPKHIVKQYQQTKDIEKVIKDGEDTIADSAEKLIKSQATKIGTSFMTEVLKEAKGQVMGTGSKPVPPPQDFNQRMNERMAGGATNEEQGQMWGRYEKQKQKQAKKEMQKAFFMPAKDDNEKQVAKDRLKDTRKEQRGKDPKDPIFKAIKEKLENNLAEAHKAADRSQFKTIMGNLGISLAELNGLTDEQKGEVEELCLIPKGKLEEYLA